MAKGTTRRQDAEISALDRIRQLDEERREIMEQAKAEAMSKVDEAIGELNSLGFSYRVVQDGRSGRSKEGTRGGTRRSNPDRPCPVCGFQTSPPHDARAHRSQGENKRPFAAEELEARGMEQV